MKLLMGAFLFWSSQLQAQLKPNSEGNEYLKQYFECEEGLHCQRMLRTLARDSKSGCRPEPEKLESLDRYLPWLKKNTKTVRGSTFYAGLFPGRYGYFMYNDNNEVVIHTRIHFRNLHSLPEWFQKELKYRFAQAAQIWNRFNPFEYPVRFQFELTEDPAQAFVKNIRLMNKTSGPYFNRWNINWSIQTIAHEFGHVLGLDDEYSYIANGALNQKLERVCDKTSFMCRSYGNSEIKPFHYYMVLRRLFCK